MPFNLTGPHYCPDCPQGLNRKGKRVGRRLELIEDGSGSDAVYCSKCGHGFVITYKVTVDSITRESYWDVAVEPPEPINFEI